jgi:hypothetical protein
MMLAPVGPANLRMDANAERVEELIFEGTAISGTSLNLQQPKRENDCS